AAGVETKASDLRLDGGDRRPAHAELVHAQAEGGGPRAPITANAPTDPNPLSLGTGALDGEGDQAKHGRAQAVHLRSEPGMSAVHGERVLVDIVRADREECPLAVARA